MPHEPQTTGWQPMETAPRDGTPVQLLFRDGDIAIRLWTLVGEGGEEEGAWVSHEAEGFTCYGDGAVAGWMHIGPASGWQPMETAPRDGSRVLGWARVGWVEGGGLDTASDERRRVVMYWSAFTRRIDIEAMGGDGQWLLESSTPYGEVADPVLWAPLLEEPADA